MADALILAGKGAQFSSSGECGGVSAATNFEEMRTRQPITICFSGCKTDSVCKPDGRTADPKILQDLILLSQFNLQYKVNSIATGSHGSVSAHYLGKAVDLAPIPGAATTFLQLRDQMKALNPSSLYIACENNSLQVFASCGAGTTHVHVTYP